MLLAGDDPGVGKSLDRDENDNKGKQTEKIKHLAEKPVMRSQRCCRQGEMRQGCKCFSSLDKD